MSSCSPGSPPPVARLAQRQLEAYNRADLDAFCACYADDVVVLDEAGSVSIAGMTDFRARYAKLFASFTDVRAEVLRSLVLGRHCIDEEAWSRRDRATGEISSGRLLVRYTEREGRLAIVEMLR